jgi:hypothetical protein
MTKAKSPIKKMPVEPKEPTITAIKTYTITVTDYSDGRTVRTHDIKGFNMLQAFEQITIESEIIRAQLMHAWGFGQQQES